MMELVTRRCACGCRLTFRCFPTSPQTYASRNCEASVTPGGFVTMMRETSRKSRIRKIPAEAKGEVSSMQLADMLGVSYQTIFHWTRAGQITPVPSQERNRKYDLAKVREQLGGESA